MTGAALQMLSRPCASQLLQASLTGGLLLLLQRGYLAGTCLVPPCRCYLGPVLLSC